MDVRIKQITTLYFCFRKIPRKQKYKRDSDDGMAQNNELILTIFSGDVGAPIHSRGEN